MIICEDQEVVLSFDANFSFFSLGERSPRDLQLLLTKNGLLMRNVVQRSLSANNILLMRKRNHAFLLLAIVLNNNNKKKKKKKKKKKI